MPKKFSCQIYVEPLPNTLGIVPNGNNSFLTVHPLHPWVLTMTGTVNPLFTVHSTFIKIFNLKSLEKILSSHFYYIFMSSIILQIFFSYLQIVIEKKCLFSGTFFAFSISEYANVDLWDHYS